MNPSLSLSIRTFVNQINWFFSWQWWPQDLRCCCIRKYTQSPIWSGCILSTTSVWLKPRNARPSMMKLFPNAVAGFLDIWSILNGVPFLLRPKIKCMNEWKYNVWELCPTFSYFILFFILGCPKTGPPSYVIDKIDSYPWISHDLFE